MNHITSKLRGNFGRFLVMLSLLAISLPQLSQALTVQEILQGYDNPQPRVLGAATPAFVQSAFSINNPNSTTAAATFIANVTAGNVIAVAAASGGTAAISSVTASCITGNLTLVANDTATLPSGLAYGVVTTTGPCSVTANFAASGFGNIIMIHEITGINTTSPLDGGSTLLNSFGTSPAVSSSITTTGADYIFGASVSSSGATTYIAGSGLTLRVNQASFGSEDAVQSSAGAITASFTPSNGAYSRVGIMAFKPATGGGPTPTPTPTPTVTPTPTPTATPTPTPTPTVTPTPSPTPTQSGSLLYGILDPTRAINWQRANVGVEGGIPTNYTLCATVSPGASAVSISNTIANCPNFTYVQLTAGTYNLSQSVVINRSDVIVRGAGPTQTQLNFTGAGAGGIFSGTFYIGTSQQLGSNDCNGAPNYSTCPGQSNAADWTGGFGQGATSITLANIGATGIAVGDTIILDQRNDVQDNGGYMSCDNGGGGLSPEQGVTFGCMDSFGQPAGNTGRIIGGVPYAQMQMVKVAAISGTGCSGSPISCSGAGPFTVTLATGLSENNWNQGNAAGHTGAWFVKPIQFVGMENLAIDASGCPNDASCNSGISFVNVVSGWVKNVRLVHTRRNHVWFENTSRMEIRDSYMYAANNAASQSYGLECFECQNSLVENNIVQQTAGPYVLAGGSNNVFGYNFALDNVQWPPGWNQSDLTLHSDGSDLMLFEGNQGSSLIADTLHGDSGKITGFRNWLSGHGYNTCTSGGSGNCSDFNNRNNLATDQTFPIDYNSYTRGMNLIGNVLGTPGYHNAANGGAYQNSATANDAGNEGVSQSQCDHSIYNLGWSQGLCANLGNVGLVNDPLVKTTLMRWGNYDAFTGTVRWDNAEASPPAATYIAAQAVPASHFLPASMYLSGKPSWWPSSIPYPPIGPDVTGGSGPSGLAYNNPAANCYYNVLGGPVDGSGNPLPFDANNCYATGGGGGGDTTPPSVPTNLTASAISSSAVSLSWTASTDNVGVTGYKVFRAGVQIGTTITNNYNDNGLTAGTNYSYTVSAYDAAGNNSAQSTSASATTLNGPDTTPPNVNITSPSAGTVSGSITFSATASDPVVAGQTTSGLKTITLSIDGSVFATSSTASASKALDTTTLTNASHSLTAIAVDNAGNQSTTATVSITVNNVSATKFPRTISLTSLEGIASIPANQTITATVLSGSTVLETQSNLTPTAGKYTVAFLNSDPQLVSIRIKATGYLSQLLSNIDTTVNSAVALSVPQLNAGDFNNDNTINALDYSILNSHYNQNYPTADINLDGLVNSLDFAILKNNFNKLGQ